MPHDPSPAQFTSRLLLDQIADKWTALILGALCPGPMRFNGIRRALDGVTQTALTKTLRRLERNGVVRRTVTTDAVIAVEYEITPLGRSLGPLFQSLDAWTREHLAAVEDARRAYDARQLH